MKLCSVDRVSQFVTNSLIQYDSPRHGGIYWDIDAIYTDPGLLSETAYEMARPFIGYTDVILCADSCAVVGEKVAANLHLPLVLAHQPGSSPKRGIKVGMQGRTRYVGLEIPVGAIDRDSRVLIVDSVVGDGCVVEVLGELVKLSFATIAGVTSLMAGQWRDGEKEVFAVVL